MGIGYMNWFVAKSVFCSTKMQKKFPNIQYYVQVLPSVSQTAASIVT